MVIRQKIFAAMLAATLTMGSAMPRNGSADCCNDKRKRNMGSGLLLEDPFIYLSRYTPAGVGSGYVGNVGKE